MRRIYWKELPLYVVIIVIVLLLFGGIPGILSESWQFIKDILIWIGYFLVILIIAFSLLHFKDKFLIRRGLSIEKITQYGDMFVISPLVLIFVSFSFYFIWKAAIEEKQVFFFFSGIGAGLFTGILLISLSLISGNNKQKNAQLLPFRNPYHNLIFMVGLGILSMVERFFLSIVFETNPTLKFFIVAGIFSFAGVALVFKLSIMILEEIMHRD